jgi:tetratricopeptide (TPR) repeat protein
MKHQGPEELWDKLQECLEKVASTLANLAAQQQFTQFPLIPPEEKEIAQKVVSNTFLPIGKRMEAGMLKILDLLTSADAHEPGLFPDKTHEQLCQIAAIASVLAEHPEKYLSLLADAKTLQEVFTIDDETLESLYQATKHLYEQQHYAEAAAAFSILSAVNPNNHTFCRHYEAALTAYAMAAQSNPCDPLCHFFSARCYEAMNQKELAINALELALISIGDNEEFTPWKQKASEHKQRLQRKK